MNSTILKYSIISLSIFTFTFSQQERLMWEDLVDKKGVKYATGSKKPYTGRVFDNYKNKGRKLTGYFKNGKEDGYALKFEKSWGGKSRMLLSFIKTSSYL